MSKSKYNDSADLLCVAYDEYSRGKVDSALRKCILAFEGKGMEGLRDGLLSFNDLANMDYESGEDMEDLEDTPTNPATENFPDEDLEATFKHIAKTRKQISAVSEFELEVEEDLEDLPQDSNEDEIVEEYNGEDFEGELPVEELEDENLEATEEEVEEVLEEELEGEEPTEDLDVEEDLESEMDKKEYSKNNQVAKKDLTAKQIVANLKSLKAKSALKKLNKK